MKTVLVNLPWLRDGRMGVRAGSRWPFTSSPEMSGRIHYIPFPFFLAYAAALLKREGCSVRLIDAVAMQCSLSEFLLTVTEEGAGLLVAEISTPSFKNDIQIIEAIKRENRDVKVCLCGPHAGTFPGDILREHLCIDYVMVGEYEFTLLGLVTALESRSGLQDIEGLAYREGIEVIVNRPRLSLADLNGLPWPERDEQAIYQYNDGFAGLPLPNVQMWASRGCPFHCTFCLWPQTMYKGHFRKRDPRDVVDEMEYLIQRFNFKAVYFDDDIFNADRAHVLSICGEIIRRKLIIPWAVMARLDLMDDELLRIMVKAGLYAVKYGIESADKEIIQSCRKELDLGKVREVVGATKKLGIKVHLTFCIGLPGETRETIQKTADFAKSLSPDSVQFSFATPFPGTEYFDYVSNNGWLCSRDWDDFDGKQKCIVRTKDLSAQDLEKMQAVLAGMFDLK